MSERTMGHVCTKPTACLSLRKQMAHTAGKKGFGLENKYRELHEEGDA